eukprot:1696969-Rhodomonas_salina.2
MRLPGQRSTRARVADPHRLGPECTGDRVARLRGVVHGRSEQRWESNRPGACNVLAANRAPPLPSPLHSSDTLLIAYRPTSSRAFLQKPLFQTATLYGKGQT